MRIKMGSIVLATVAVCGIAAFSAPAANAYELKINGDECTYTFNEQDNRDVNALRRLEVEKGNQIKSSWIKSIKETLPEVSSEIDQFMKLLAEEKGESNEFKAVEAVIETEAMKDGFYSEEIRTLLVQSQQSSVGSIELTLTPGQIHTKASAAEDIELFELAAPYGVIVDVAESNWSSPAKQELSIKLSEALPFYEPVVDVKVNRLRNCVEGKAGTYRYYDGGDTNNTPPAGGSSFGSS